MIEIERPPRDFIVVQPCDSHDKQKQLAISSSPSDGDNDDDEKEEERTYLIQDARQKGRRRERVDTSRLYHSQTLTAALQKTQNHSFSYLCCNFQGLTVRRKCFHKQIMSFNTPKTKGELISNVLTQLTIISKF